MSIPKENIWQDLRQSCLDAIPSESRSSMAQPRNLAAWQGHGYFRVHAATKKQFELAVPIDDFGSALLTDVECLLDNAAEHQASLWKHINAKEWHSPAWLGVTVYYWSFFLCLATTRLTGRTTWHLTQDSVKDLKKLAGATNTPGAGCYHVICGAPMNATERLVTLRKTDGRVHDEIWRLWFKECSRRLSLVPPSAPLSDEIRLFKAIVRTSQVLGDDWPSAFRNMVNYRSGFAYTAVRRKTVLKSLSFLRDPCSYAAVDLIDRFEQSIVKAPASKAIQNAPQVVLELLLDLTFLMHAIATELHRELIDRHRLDGRWRLSRQRFFKENQLTDADTQKCWPL